MQTSCDRVKTACVWICAAGVSRCLLHVDRCRLASQIQICSKVKSAKIGIAPEDNKEKRIARYAIIFRWHIEKGGKEKIVLSAVSRRERRWQSRWSGRRERWLKSKARAFPWFPCSAVHSLAPSLLPSLLPFFPFSTRFEPRLYTFFALYCYTLLPLLPYKHTSSERDCITQCILRVDFISPSSLYLAVALSFRAVSELEREFFKRQAGEELS